MYHHVEGELVVLGPTRAVLDAGGVGYDLRIPLSTYRSLKGREGGRVRLLTHLQVLEDDLRLYGFSGEGERELFRIATAIPGVGPSTALALLASFDAAGLAGAVAAGDPAALRRVKGVGPKLSERILLELKDRVVELSALAGPGADGSPAASREARARGGLEKVAADAVSALVTLGFQRREAVRKVEEIVKDLLARSQGEPSLEAIIQAALRSRD